MKIRVLVAWHLLAVAVGQAQNLSGVIVDDSGVPIAHVFIENLTNEAQALSAEDGTFRLPVTHLPAEIRLQHLSFEDKIIRLDSIPSATLHIQLQPASLTLDPVEVIHHWATGKTPMTYTNYPGAEIQKQNTGQDMPYLLRYTPSLWVNSDAGNGIGYTSMRIRGSDPTRINVTINGVPLNDPESQYVFWVDLPDFASSTKQMQIQRGVGTSTNGAGAFGASINLNTQSFTTGPQARITGSLGSFNTRRASAEVSTGLINNHFQMDGRLSTIHSDGYIDRARADLRSYYLSAAYLNRNTSLRFLHFSGKENTYQAWDGVPATYIDDPQLRRYNSAGSERPGSPHPNEIDDYQQSHYQAIWNQKLSVFMDLNVTLHYTKGYGYFEQYKADQLLSDYGITDPTGQHLTTNLIRRRWLDNDFYGALASWALHTAKGMTWTLGAAGNDYLGNHYGEVIWASFMGDAEQGFRYYDNDARKRDLSAYSKWEIPLTRQLQSYLDLQVRQVYYDFLGTGQDGRPLRQSVQLPFFNPKAGLSWVPSAHHRAYLSFAVGHKEPNRDDYTESSSSQHPLPESLYNTELGWDWSGARASLGANIYHMYYVNQLVLNGQINDVGAYTRINIPKSYRAGIEVQSQWQPLEKLEIITNLTWSQNRVRKFTDYVDDWDAGGQIPVEYRNTSLSFSPQWVNNQQIRYYLQGNKEASRNILVQWAWNHVSRQNLDNTQQKEASIPGYWVNDLALIGSIPVKNGPQIGWNIQVQNLWNTLYTTNGWVYRFSSAGYDPRPDDPYAQLESGTRYHLAGYYPQATRQVLASLTLTW
ncbi:MAG: TonB-dependent receptor [Saprospiraceae bacterium]|nr:TonB-dependent receptor [Saprospiraceae bacterium]MCB9318310.1 TonB-dependent receptor [Lewinellaceae bacterium]